MTLSRRYQTARRVWPHSTRNAASTVLNDRYEAGAEWSEGIALVGLCTLSSGFVGIVFRTYRSFGITGLTGSTTEHMSNHDTETTAETSEDEQNVSDAALAEIEALRRGLTPKHVWRRSE